MLGGFAKDFKASYYRIDGLLIPGKHDSKESHPMSQRNPLPLGEKYHITRSPEFFVAADICCRTATSTIPAIPDFSTTVFPV
jgi:hypothetical protein